jgi:D-3-phosphoglycerate dehydrogenase
VEALVRELTMRVAVLDDYQDCVRTLSCFEKLRGHDVQVHTQRFADERALAAALQDREALVLIRERTKVTRSLLAMLPNLKLLSQTGRPGHHLDAAACAERGIVVTEGKGSPNAPAELTFALMLAANRRLVTEANALKDGVWQTTLGTTLRNRTLGVHGYGAIGALVAQFARAFGMNVIATGREGSATRARADGVTFVDTPTLYATSDVVSLHVKLNAQTRGLVTLAELQSMKPGALFVNTSRAAERARGWPPGLRRGRRVRAGADHHRPAHPSPARAGHAPPGLRREGQLRAVLRGGVRQRGRLRGRPRPESRRRDRLSAEVLHTKA